MNPGEAGDNGGKQETTEVGPLAMSEHHLRLTLSS
jgi:hypothetical protein